MEWRYLNKIHSIPAKASLRLKLYFLRKRLYVWLQYVFGLRKVNHVITISEYSQNALLSEFPVLKDKTSFVYHGIPDNYQPLPGYSDVKARKGTLMLGGESYQKNPVNALKAYSLLPETCKNEHPLTIAGFKPTDNSPILSAIKEFGLTKHVTVLNWVEEEELVELFQKCRTLLFVSREEGFGFPLVQAMACGTPVVISDAEVLTEIAGNAAVGAPAEDPNSIAKILLQTLTDDSYWHAIHQKCISRASDFTWDTMSRHIISCYERFIK